MRVVVVPLTTAVITGIGLRRVMLWSVTQCRTRDDTTHVAGAAVTIAPACAIAMARVYNLWCVVARGRVRAVGARGGRVVVLPRAVAIAAFVVTRGVARRVVVVATVAIPDASRPVVPAGRRVGVVAVVGGVARRVHDGLRVACSRAMV